MYISPITIIKKELQMQQEAINTEIENNIMLTLTQTYGIEVDKDELIRALKYDRQQYKEGRADFKSDVMNVLKEYICHYIQIDAFEREKNILEEIVDRIKDLT